ncbi:MAG: hypothetical protein ABIK45_07110 [Pseudomonadota bacterium]
MSRSSRPIWMAAALLAVLPTSLAGCLAVNAMFGVLGLVGPAPIQYAGTAYSVGEYAYHFTVNDKTPDEVLGEKFAWLTGLDEPLTPETHTPASPRVEPSFMLASAEPAPMAAMGQVAIPPAPAPSKKRETAPIATISRESNPETAPEPIRRAGTDQPDSRPAHAVVIPHAVVIAHAVVIGPDSQAERLNRLESSLAQAERMYLRGFVQGVRCTASTPDGQGGVSGTGSVRHPIMQTAPVEPWRVARPDSVPESLSNAETSLAVRS